MPSRRAIAAFAFAIVSLAAGCAGPGPGGPRPAPAASLAKPTGPDQAFKWRRLAWLDERGEVTNAQIERARAERDANIAWAMSQGGPEGSVAAAETWQEHGPTNVGGRTRSLVVDPTNTQRMWAGSVGGGVWRSTDGGRSWTALWERQATLPVGSLALDPSNPNVIYAGTGEGQFNGDALGGDGIFKSADGGNTWTQLPATDGWDTVNCIAVCPSNPQVILASKRYGGIMRSADGGATWANARWGQGSFDVRWHPTNPNLAVAHLMDYTSDWCHRAIYTTDGGVTWTNAGGLAEVLGFGNRLAVCYAPSSPNIVYAVCAADGGRIWKSTDGGQNYAVVTTSGGCGCNWYACPLWVHPTNPNFVMTGGYHVYASTNGGVTLSQVSNGYILTDQVHPDIHGILSDPGFNGTTNRRVYVVCDGGCFVTDNVETASGSAGWVQLNRSYRTSQFYGAAGVELPLRPATPVTGALSGLDARYYALASPTVLPDFAALTPYSTTTVPALAFPSTSGNFATSGRADNVGAVFAGWLEVPYDGLWTLSTESDDGSALLVDGTPLVSNDGLHGMLEKKGLTALKAGKHAIEVRFFEAGGGAGLILRIEGPGVARQAVPASMLSRGGTAGTPAPTTDTLGFVFGGTQDNGTLRVIRGQQDAILPYGGDGGFCAVDSQDPRYCYGEYVNLKIHRSSDWGASAGNIYQNLPDANTPAANFIAPFILDPNQTGRMWAGGASLWRSDDVRAASVAWTQARGPGSSNVSAIAVAPGNSNVVWMAQNDGQVWKTSDALSAAPTWTPVDNNGSANPIPNRYVTRIVLQNSTGSVAFVTLGGFSGDNVLRTVNGGLSFGDVTGGNGPNALPSIPVRGIALHPDLTTRWFVGTEWGVYQTRDAGLNWFPMLAGPPAVSVDEVAIVPGSRRLLAATHGRGMWSADLSLPNADLNGDGVVNGSDLGLLLASFGPCANCPADLDGNVRVDGADLGILLAAWR
jgi:hypothetical protein